MESESLIHEKMMKIRFQFRFQSLNRNTSRPTHFQESATKEQGALQEEGDMFATCVTSRL